MAAPPKLVTITGINMYEYYILSLSERYAQHDKGKSCNLIDIIEYIFFLSKIDQIV